MTFDHDHHRFGAAGLQPLLLALGGLLALATAMGIGRFMYTAILPSMSQALALSKGEAGLIASANFVGYLIGALIAALPNWPGRERAWLLFFLATSAVTTGVMAATDDLALFLVLRFLGGFASAGVLVFASTLIIERLALVGRRDLISWHFAGVGVGIALSALIAWVAGGPAADWRELWIAGGLISALATAAVFFLVGDQPHHAAAAAAPASPIGGRLWPLIIAYGLLGFGYVITATFIVDIVRGAPHISHLEPVVWLTVGLAAVPSVAFWGRLARRFGLIRIYAVAGLVEAAGVLASVLAVGPVGLIIAAVFLGGTFVGMTALGLTAARDLSRGRARSVLALMTAAFGLGQIIGPLVAGFGFDLTGSYLWPSVSAAGALVLGAALTALVRSPHRRL